jgi:hypothetical protein
MRDTHDVRASGQTSLWGPFFPDIAGGFGIIGVQHTFSSSPHLFASMQFAERSAAALAAAMLLATQGR